MAITPLGKNILVEIVTETPKAGEIIVPPGKFDLKKLKVLSKGTEAGDKFKEGDIVLSDSFGYTVPGSRTQFILNSDDVIAVVT